MKVDNKFINFKLSSNGKMQMTGVKKDEHAIACIKYLWKYIETIEDAIQIKEDGNKLKVIVKVVMTNIDFSVGFLINRQNLDQYFNTLTDYHSLLETSFGYTGVNIKFPSKIDKDRLLDMFTKEINSKDDNWEKEKILFSEYLDMLTPTEKQKEINKKKYNTFLIFHSGNVIMSGSIKEKMKDPYHEFIRIIDKAKDEIIEKLDV